MLRSKARFWGFAALAFWLTVSACAAVKDFNKDKAQQVTEACARANLSLQLDKDAGVPCEVARERVIKQEPLCPLVFTCPTP